MEVRTTLSTEDIKSYYGINPALKKQLLGRGISKNFSFLLALFFWLLAIFVVFAQIPPGHVLLIIQGLFMGMIFASLGLRFFVNARPCLMGRVDGKARKKEQLIYVFNETEFTVKSQNVKQRVQYTKLGRVSEDQERFYFVINSKEGYVLPKRDIPDDQIRILRGLLKGIGRYDK